MSGECPHRPCHLVARGGADLAEVLGHDVGWGKSCQQLDIHLVEALPPAKGAAGRGVYLSEPRLTVAWNPAVHQNRPVPDLGWVIAAVADAHHALRKPDRAGHLGGRGKERHQPYLRRGRGGGHGVGTGRVEADRSRRPGMRRSASQRPPKRTAEYKRSPATPLRRKGSPAP